MAGEVARPVLTCKFSNLVFHPLILIKQMSSLFPMVSGHLVLGEGVALNPVSPNRIVDINWPTDKPESLMPLGVSPVSCVLA